MPAGERVLLERGISINDMRSESYDLVPDDEEDRASDLDHATSAIARGSQEDEGPCKAKIERFRHGRPRLLLAG